MKKVLYFVSALILAACSQPDKTNVESKVDQEKVENSDSGSSEFERKKRNAPETTNAVETKLQVTSFNGNWFSVEYPSNFVALPKGPKNKFDNYEYVETDEALFTSPDGTVEFFVYSPQWSGDPKDYLIQKANEKTVSDSEDKANFDDPYAVSHRWVTYEDKGGKYTRAYHSQKTESTHLVFGVKYTSKKMYERYKAAYMAFKKSLQQFAD